MGTALLRGYMAGAVEKPKPNGAYRVTVWRGYELEPRKPGRISFIIPFPGYNYPGDYNKPYNTSYQHTPGNNIGYNDKNSM